MAYSCIQLLTHARRRVITSALSGRRVADRAAILGDEVHRIAALGGALQHVDGPYAHLGYQGLPQANVGLYWGLLPACRTPPSQQRQPRWRTAWRRRTP
eukprot:scaffold2827_cov409-Prasinococcus_capsulatus_cf.AAC.5